jgi:hypothetical protein
MNFGRSRASAAGLFMRCNPGATVRITAAGLA